MVIKMSTHEERIRRKPLKTNIVPAAACDEKFMRIALLEAESAEKSGEVPVGAIVVYSGEIISSAHNQCEGGHSALLHAEMEALRMACEVRHSWRLHGCTLYVTLEPCPMCAGAIINSHIDRVVFGAKDSSAGAFGSVINLTSYPVGFKPKLTAGVLKDECAGMLQHFFYELRNKKTKAETND